MFAELVNNFCILDVCLNERKVRCFQYTSRDAAEHGFTSGNRLIWFIGIFRDNDIQSLGLSRQIPNSWSV